MYKILLENFKSNKTPFYWICNRIHYSVELTLEERKVLFYHFQSQKPSETQYQEFFNDSRFNKNTTQWWGRQEQGVRIEFLEAIIKKLENN